MFLHTSAISHSSIIITDMNTVTLHEWVFWMLLISWCCTFLSRFVPLFWLWTSQSRYQI
jgi:hypothetical protein